MARMKSRNEFPPKGWQVLHPEAGMNQPFTGSFSECVAWELNWRRGNPSLAQRLGLTPDVASVEAWIDTQNAIRCLSHGWTDFVDIEATPAPSTAAALQKKNLLARAAGVVAKGRAAASAYFTLFGSHGPVEKEVATRRAQVCAACPQNDVQGGLLAHFTKDAADRIMALLGAFRDLDLQTSEDARLGVCVACDCPMRAKVWVPLDNLVSHMPADVWPKLNKASPVCWIKTEANR